MAVGGPITFSDYGYERVSRALESSRFLAGGRCHRWTTKAAASRSRIAHCLAASAWNVGEEQRSKSGTARTLNRNTEVVAAQSVTIGRDCKIARDVIIMDTDQHELPGGGLVVRPVEIEDRVWIGARAIILKGVTVGHDAVIAAGSVVTRDVPPRTVAAGVPARVVRRF